MIALNNKNKTVVIPVGVESFLTTDQINEIKQKIEKLNEFDHATLVTELNDLELESKTIGYSIDEISEAFLDIIDEFEITEFTLPEPNPSNQTGKLAVLDTFSSHQVDKLVLLTENLTLSEEIKLKALLKQLEKVNKEETDLKKINNRVVGVFAYVTGEDLSNFMQS